LENRNEKEVYNNLQNEIIRQANYEKYLARQALATKRKESIERRKEKEAIERKLLKEINEKRRAGIRERNYNILCEKRNGYLLK
jgi:hypothetical protein